MIRENNILTSVICDASIFESVNRTTDPLADSQYRSIFEVFYYSNFYHHIIVRTYFIRRFSNDVLAILSASQYDFPIFYFSVSRATGIHIRSLSYTGPSLER